MKGLPDRGVPARREAVAHNIVVRRVAGGGSQTAQVAAQAWRSVSENGNWHFQARRGSG